MKIVVIASIPYTFPLYQRIHHFTEMFVKEGHEVLFIEPIKFTKNERPKKNLEIWYPRVEGASVFYIMKEKQHEWTMKYRGMYRFFQLMRLLGGFRLYRFLRDRYERKIHRVTHTKGFEDKVREKLAEKSRAKRKIAFFQFPHQVEHIPYLKELGYKIVYDMVDDIAEFDEVPRDIRAREIELLKSADLVTTTATPLMETARKYNNNVKLIPNGVEYKHFVKARGKLRKPKDMPRGKPIIGYYGAIWTWFDGDLLLYLAKKRPQYDFVLIGTMIESLRGKFGRKKNIRYLGEKKYHVLPAYLRCFDVAVVPFKDNNLTKAVNPVKIYEYLAGGKNVVYTGLKELGDFPCVHTGSNKEEILAKLDDCLGKRCDLGEIDIFLKDKTWVSRYAALSRELKKL